MTVKLEELAHQFAKGGERQRAVRRAPTLKARRMATNMKCADKMESDC